MFKSILTIQIFIASITVLIIGNSWSQVADPTRPAYLKSKKVIKKSKPAKPLVVGSIIMSPNRRVAIINNKVVAIGDHVDNAVVTAINKNYVEVRRKNKLIILRFNRLENFKQRVTVQTVVNKISTTENSSE